MGLLAEIALRGGEPWGPKSNHCAFVYAKNVDSGELHHVCNPFIDKKNDQNLSESVFVAPFLWYHPTV